MLNELSYKAKLTNLKLNGSCSPIRLAVTQASKMAITSRHAQPAFIKAKLASLKLNGSCSPIRLAHTQAGKMTIISRHAKRAFIKSKNWLA